MPAAATKGSSTDANSCNISHAATASPASNAKRCARVVRNGECAATGGASWDTTGGGGACGAGSRVRSGRVLTPER
jgi:hypothetical protein